MNEALQHGSQGAELSTTAPNSFDFLRIFVLFAVLLLIAYRCHQQYLTNRTLASDSILHLHLRSLDGYRAGVPIYIANHISARPRGFILIPAESTELLAERRLWNKSAATAHAAGMFPIIVCTSSSCPLSEGETPSQADKVVVIDRLQYIPALAVARAAQRGHALILNASMTVTRVSEATGIRGRCSRCSRQAGHSMRTKRFWLIITIILCATDCIGLGIFLMLSHSTPAPHQRFDTAGMLSLQGAKLDSPKPVCRLIHYTAKTCPFCAQEYSTWLKLKSDALTAKCDVISVVPNIVELPLSSQTDTALFVSTEFARTFGATRTLTTVLTDSDGNVTWRKEGMMSISDQQKASRILARTLP